MYGGEMFGHAETPSARPPVNPLVAKERRRQQMEQFRKHQRARTAPIKRG